METPRKSKPQKSKNTIKQVFSLQSVWFLIAFSKYETMLDAKIYIFCTILKKNLNLWRLGVLENPNCKNGGFPVVNTNI